MTQLLYEIEDRFDALASESHRPALQRVYLSISLCAAAAGDTLKSLACTCSK